MIKRLIETADGDDDFRAFAARMLMIVYGTLGLLALIFGLAYLGEATHWLASVALAGFLLLFVTALVVSPPAKPQPEPEQDPNPLNMPVWADDEVN